MLLQFGWTSRTPRAFVVVRDERKSWWGRRGLMAAASRMAKKGGTPRCSNSGYQGKGDNHRIEMEIARIRSLGIDDLRASWQRKFERSVPAALSKALMSRMLCFKIQEEVFGGFGRATQKRLQAYANGKGDEGRQARHLKPGTELLREYQGERLKVIVTEDGFVFEGKSYASLTSIARKVTGTNWNGPRFFGLRMSDDRLSSPRTMVRTQLKEMGSNIGALA
jgi:hypothetical protein